MYTCASRVYSEGVAIERNATVDQHARSYVAGILTFGRRPPDSPLSRETSFAHAKSNASQSFDSYTRARSQKTSPYTWARRARAGSLTAHLHIPPTRLSAH